MILAGDRRQAKALSSVRYASPLMRPQIPVWRYQCGTRLPRKALPVINELRIAATDNVLEIAVAVVPRACCTA